MCDCTKVLKKMLLSLILVSIVCGCANTKSKSVDLKNIDAKSGNLIALWLLYPERYGKDWPDRYPGCKSAVLVTEPYAIYMEWKGETYPQNTQQFYIFDNVIKKTFKTSDFDHFLKEFARLPENIKVHNIDSCTVSCSKDMPSAERNRLELAMKNGNREWFTEYGGFCRCESIGFEHP